MTYGNYSMSDKSTSGYGHNKSQGCGCGGHQTAAGGCTLAAPMPYVHACNPAPMHRAACQSDPYFSMSVAYGRW